MTRDLAKLVALCIALSSCAPAETRTVVIHVPHPATTRPQIWAIEAPGAWKHRTPWAKLVHDVSRFLRFEYH